MASIEIVVKDPPKEDIVVRDNHYYYIEDHIYNRSGIVKVMEHEVISFGKSVKVLDRETFDICIEGGEYVVMHEVEPKQFIFERI